MNARWFRFSAILAAAAVAPAVVQAQAPVGTAFTYQGQLKQAGEPLNDTADFEFTLWDDPTSADPNDQVGPMVPVDNKDVVGGLFAVVLDFGEIPFTTNEARWLQIEVRSPSGAGEFTTLSPRQQLTPTAFSLATRGINVDAIGNVGIGTPSPVEKLDVVGTALVEGFRMPPGAVGGYVLTTDDFGVGNWQPPGEFTLPFEGMTQSQGPAMKITNTGQGKAIVGRHNLSGNFGYLGGSQAAVYGEAPDGGFGALAWAEDGRGGDYGTKGNGKIAGGDFADTNNYGQALCGTDEWGIKAYGSELEGGGGYFAEHRVPWASNWRSLARCAYASQGIEAWGEECGGYFATYNSASDEYFAEAYIARGDYGIEAWGEECGGYFADSEVDPTRYAFIAAFDAAGLFVDADDSGTAKLGYGNVGIDARGDTTGGFFKDLDDSGQAYLGHGELGIKATGNEMGGHFKNTTPGTSVEAKLAYTDGVHTYGVKAEGGWYGISASGSFRGGEFERTDGRSYAHVATYDYGIKAYSAHTGGYFENTGNGNTVSLAGETRAGFLYNVSSGNIVRLAGQTWAGNFSGDVQVDGDFEVTGTKSFRIDHPLDPANKYLVHSCIESPDRMNVYNGNVVLDGNGEAWVELPEWFEALNRDFRYQLTCIGGFAPVYVAEKIADNCFKIAGGEPGMEISWQVTGIRQDPYAEAHPITVEEEKAENERGKYLHPTLYGEPETKTIGYDERPGPAGR